MFEVLKWIKNDNLINQNSYNLLYQFATFNKQNYEGLITDAQLKSNIESLVVQFNNYDYSVNGEGQMISAVFDIALASIEWWEENPDEIAGHLKVAPWVIADGIGALFSGGIALYFQDENNINWGAVGGAALGGAIGASTGGAGKIAKWLS